MDEKSRGKIIVDLDQNLVIESEQDALILIPKQWKEYLINNLNLIVQQYKEQTSGPQDLLWAKTVI